MIEGVPIPESIAWNWSIEVDHALGMVEPYLHGRVLDYGCGLGRLTKPLANLHPEWTVIGYDPDPEAVAWASETTLANEIYTTTLPLGFDSAFSVLVFQHLSDADVGLAMCRIWPRPFRFQFVVGTERGPLSYQRSEDEMRDLAYPYRLEIEADPVYEEWRWALARRPG